MATSQVAISVFQLCIMLVQDPERVDAKHELTLYPLKEVLDQPSCNSESSICARRIRMQCRSMIKMSALNR